MVNHRRTGRFFAMRGGKLAWLEVHAELRVLACNDAGCAHAANTYPWGRGDTEKWPHRRPNRKNAPLWTLLYSGDVLQRTLWMC